MIPMLRDIWRKCGGTAAIEFAFVVPALIVMFMGVFEVSQALIVYMKLIDVADVVSDLIAQQTGVSTTTIGNFYTAGQLVMAPSAPGGLGLYVASITFDPNTGAASVAWSDTQGSGSTMTNAEAITLATSSSDNTAPGLGSSCVVQLASAGSCDSVIIAQATYTYTSALSYIIQHPMFMSAYVFSRPRAVFTIPCSNCP
jgi:Flp pilus assembly protein TadG